MSHGDLLHWMSRRRADVSIPSQSVLGIRQVFDTSEGGSVRRFSAAVIESSYSDTPEPVSRYVSSFSSSYVRDIIVHCGALCARFGKLW